MYTCSTGLKERCICVSDYVFTGAEVFVVHTQTWDGYYM